MPPSNDVPSEMYKKYAEHIKRDNPEAEVLHVTHDRRHEPWKSPRLHAVFESIVSRVMNDFQPEDSDFHVKKTLISTDNEILHFYRSHPRLFQVLTDRALMKDPKYRGTLKAMLDVRSQVESGAVPNDERADAAATEAVMKALTKSSPSDPAPPPPPPSPSPRTEEGGPSSE